MGHHRRLGLSPGALSPSKAVCALIVAQKQEPLEPEEVRELDTKDFRTTGRDQHPGASLMCCSDPAGESQ